MVVGSLDDNTTVGSVPPIIPNIPEAEREEKPLRIMLLGKSGAGKSSSGNTILGRQVFNSDMRLVRVTRYCKKGTGTVKDVPIDATKKVKDVPVTVIDTPGFFQTIRKDEDAVQEIMLSGHLWEPGPHAFVLVVPIARMTQEDQETNALIEAKFGPRVWDYTIVLFTHGDRLDEKTISDVIKESDDNLRNFIRKCSGGFHVFNNKDPQDEAQVTSFIAKIQTMVALNGGHPYSKALYPTEERKIMERQEEIMMTKESKFRKLERALQEKYRGEDLEMKKNELRRKEEYEARLAAEKEVRQKAAIRKMLVFVLVLGVMGLVGWALPNVVPVIIVLLLISYKAFPSMLHTAWMYITIALKNE